MVNFQESLGVSNKGLEGYYHGKKGCDCMQCCIFLILASPCKDHTPEQELQNADWRFPHGGIWDTGIGSLVLTLALVLVADG